MRKFILLNLILLCLALSIQAQQRLTLEESVRQQFTTFAPTTIDQLQWLPGRDEYVFVKDSVLYIASIKRKDQPLLTLRQLNDYLGPNPEKQFPVITWMNGRTFMFEQNGRMVHVDLDARKAEFSKTHPESAENVDYDKARKQWAYTEGNDLYVINNEKQWRITSNPSTIVSGQSVSRNEYGIEKGTFWSPDGSLLAFYQKDESEVTEYPLTNYVNVPATVKNIKYPMAGGRSEKINVGVHNTLTGETTYLDLNYGREDDQFYATNLTWAPDNRTILIAWLNRQTNLMQLKSFDATTGKEIKVLFSEKENKWIEPLHAATFVPGLSEQFLWMSERDGFMNLYLYHLSGTLLGQSKLPFEILEILGFDAKADRVFVRATGENPTEVHTYTIRLSTWEAKKVTNAAGIHQALVSSVSGAVLDTYSNLTTPNHVQLIDGKGKKVRDLLIAKNPYEGKVIGGTEVFKITSNIGDDLWCRLIKPSNFDPTKKYPVVVYLYNGPHVQLVNSGWMGGASLWMHYLADQGYLVFTLDGHGSDNRGKKFEQIIHRQLGTQEIEDQMAGVEWLKKQPFVDAERLGIHGWSYGGFMTTSMMLRKPGTFKVGVAGGPVIDWRLYEVMYTERYMDTPDENPEGYKTADLTNYVQNLKGKLLMIHGTDDDVVVLQHNMRFQKACIDKGTQVDLYLYPGHAHNVRGKDRVHLMRKVIDYLEQGLRP